MSTPTAERPWLAVDFELPADVPTMITREEVRYLYWLCSERWSGEHDVVEVGPWLGGSTYCLAAGMAANPRRSPAARLHAVDNFRWQAFMAPRAGLDLEPGDSFRPEFERALRPFAGLVEVHETRLLDEPVVDVRVAEPLEPVDGGLPPFDGATLERPVEIVFVDGAKSWRALAHLLRELAPRCVPGETLLVLQDCKVAGAYWIQIGVAMLLELEPGGLELVDVLPFNSVAFRVASADPSFLARLPETLDAIPADDCVALLERARALFAGAGDPDAAAMVAVSEVVALGAKGEWRRAVESLRRLERRPPPAVSAADVAAARAWLERTPEAPLRPPLRRRARSLARRLAR